MPDHLTPVAFFAPVLMDGGRIVDVLFATADEAEAAREKFEREWWVFVEAQRGKS